MLICNQQFGLRRRCCCPGTLTNITPHAGMPLNRSRPLLRKRSEALQKTTGEPGHGLMERQMCPRIAAVRQPTISSRPCQLHSCTYYARRTERSKMKRQASDTSLNLHLRHDINQFNGLSSHVRATNAAQDIWLHRHRRM